MGDKFGNYGGGGRNFSEVPPRFSVPPPNFQKQGNFGNSKQQWGGPNPDDSFGNQGFRDNNSKNASNFGAPPPDTFNRGNKDFGKGFAGPRRDNTMSNGGGSKGGFNKGYGGGDMIIQEDTIFVSGMDPSITEQDIQNHFGAIGVIKKDKKTMKPKIWLYKHKDTGISKGEATVTYDDINAAKSAISWFDGRDFNGSTVRVSLAQRQNNWNKSGTSGKGGMGGQRGGSTPQPNVDRGGFRGGFDRDFNANREERDGGNNRPNNQGGAGAGASARGGAGMPQREGDWRCSECNNTNFAWRNECNRCKTPKKENPSDMPPRGGFGKSPNFSDNRRSNNRPGNFGMRDGPDNMNQNMGGGGGGGGRGGGNGGFSGGNNRDPGPMRNNASGNRGIRNRPY